MKTLREMQDSLYARAKSEKDTKFNTLMDKICRSDVLKEAWSLVYANRGSPGIDGESVKQIKEREEEFLKELQEELMNRTYRVESVRRVFILKSNGKQRPLGIPTVKDRVVQQAVKLIIGPIFEADFHDSSYGYRMNRNAKQASLEIRKYLNYGCTEVVDMDISSFFDSIDHRIMMSLVENRIRDSYVLHLIREWLRAGVVYNSETTYPTLGTPQGGVISPLLANIYLNEIDRFWEEDGRYTAEKYDAHLIRWADDMVILARSNPEAIMEIMKKLLKKLKLSLNEEKSKITTAREGFDFIGFSFFRRYITRKGKEVTIFHPSRKAVRNFREKAKQTLNRKNLSIDEDEAVRRINYLITGWTNYFNHTNASRIYNVLQKFIDWLFYKFVAYRHKKRHLSLPNNIYNRVYRNKLSPMKGIIRYSAVA